MQHNIEILKSIYQSVANRFVVERDDAIARINIAISSDEPDLDALAESFRELTMAKLNIMGVQEETTNTINQYNAQVQAQAQAHAQAEKEAREAVVNKPAASDQNTPPQANAQSGYGQSSSPFPNTNGPESFE